MIHPVIALTRVMRPSLMIVAILAMAAAGDLAGQDDASSSRFNVCKKIRNMKLKAACYVVGAGMTAGEEIYDAVRRIFKRSNEQDGSEAGREPQPRTDGVTAPGTETPAPEPPAPGPPSRGEAPPQGESPGTEAPGSDDP